MHLLQQSLINAIDPNEREGGIFEFAGRSHLEPSKSLSIAELATQAGRISVALQKRLVRHTLVLIVMPHGIEFTSTLLACFSANVVAIPLTLPGWSVASPDLDRARALHRQVTEGGRTCFVIADRDTHVRLGESDDIDACLLMTVDELLEEPPGPVEVRPAENDDPALILFTSGSTGRPKGIPLTYANLWQQVCAGRAQWEIVQGSRVVTWLSPTHNFGLHFGLLVPFFAGASCSIVRTQEFSKRPVVWFEVMARHRATHVAAPNFAFDFCCDVVVPGEVPQDAMASVTHFVCGGEPVRKTSADRFFKKFAAVGARPETLCSHYGLSECGSVTTGSARNGGFVSLDAEPFKNSRASFVQSGETPVVVSNCGPVTDGCEVRIVDCDGGVPCGDGQIGEVWLRSQAVTSGYLFSDPEASDVFGCSVANSDEAGFFRTGDLGFLVEGNLYIAGRRKEVIIVRGKNHFPADIESTIAAAVGAIHLIPAVFGVERDGVEQVISLLGLEKTLPGGDYLALATLVRTAVAAQHGLALGEIVVVEREAVFGAPSSKLKRQPLKEAYMSKTLAVLWRSDDEALKSSAERGAARSGGTVTSLRERVFVPVLGERARILDADSDLTSIGLDSLQCTRLAGELELVFGVQFDPTLLFELRTLREIAEHLEDGEARADSYPAASVRLGGGGSAASAPANAELIAVTGMHCDMPGAGEGVEPFWEFLKSGGDAIASIEKERPDLWKAMCSYPGLDESELPRWAGLLSDVDAFDATFFGVSPREAECMDPQQRKVLEFVWKLAEVSGVNPLFWSGKRIGLFIGAHTSDYSEMLAARQDLMAQSGAYIDSGSHLTMIPNRASRWFNLTGPSEIVNTACSSSLVAVHRAVESLRRGECSSAIVLGINLILTPRVLLSSAQAGMLSKTGRCRTLDAQADGFVRSEGIGGVILKPLSAAVAAGDSIHGLIRAVGVNHDGRSNSLRAPNGAAQKRLLVSTYEDAGFDPGSVTYVEMHGTGTSLGDPIEVRALAEAFQALAPDGKSGQCGLGSVKSNIGHTESAAGIAGFIKVMLAFRHRVLPKTLHLDCINPLIDLQNTPFRAIRDNESWHPSDRTHGDALPRRAGVSSFGFGGVNAHVVLEEYVAPGPASEPVRALPESPAVVVLSARNEERLKAQVEQLLAWMGQRELTAADLAAMAYTLQVGRDAMEFRLAVIAGTVAELQGKLQGYLQGAQHQDDVYRGEVRRNKDALAVFAADEDLQGAIQTWLAKGKHAKLADLWVKGLMFDWTRLYGAARPARLSLPTYPFAKESYWVSAPRPRPTIPMQEADQHVHPLVHRNTSSLEQSRFTTVFTGEEFFLKDHVVKGRRLLPAVAQLEMARVAVAKGWDLPEDEALNITLNDVVFSRPIAIQEIASPLHIRLEPQEEGDLVYKLYTEGADGTVTYGQGRATLSAESLEETLDLSELQRECIRLIPANDYYQDFRNLGLQYGAALQGLRQVQIGQRADGDRFVLAQWVLPECVVGTHAQYSLHPSIADSALQACVALMSDAGSAKALALPFAVERVQLLGSLPAQGWAVLSYSLGSDSRAGLRKVDLVITDENGRACARLDGFSARLVDESATVESSNKGSLPATSPITLIPTWEVENPLPVEPWPANSAHVLVVGGSAEQQRSLRQRYARTTALKLSADGTAAIDVLPGDLDHVVWIPQSPGGRRLENSELVGAQRHSVLFGLSLIKTLLQQGYGHRPLGWTIITQNAVLVSADDVPSPAHASLHGLIGSLAKEHVSWKVRLADMPTTDWQLEDILRLPPQHLGNAYAYRQKQWHQPRLLPAALPRLDESVFRKNGVYVIVGGAGGIGEALSEYLIQNYQARVAWVGRRPANAWIAAKQVRLGQFGEAPLYICADAADVAMLEVARDQIRERYGSIHGVVHSALVLNDGSIERLDANDFEAALSAKVDVAVSMAHVFKNERLDFFLVFSSLQSTAKAPGQSNYAAGCTFIDSFSHELRKSGGVPVKLVNWGYWGSVGVVANEQYRQRLAKFGMDSIEPSEAMQFLERFLAAPVAQAAFLKINDRRLAETLGVLSTERIAVAPSAPATTPTSDVSKLGLPLSEAGFRQADELELLLGALLCSQLHELNWLRVDVPLWPAQRAAGLPEYFTRWLDQGLRILGSQGLARQHDGGWLGTAIPDRPALLRAWAELKADAQHDHRRAQICLLDATLTALPSILNGKQSATQSMFPQGSMDLVENIYRENHVADHFNEVLVERLEQFVRSRIAADPNTRLKIVEIGAGTGGTSSLVFKRLSPFVNHVDEYCYTDVSKVFLLDAQERFGAEAPYMKARLLNIEHSPVEQGFALGEFDAVIATNVLHATRSIRQALRNAKALMKGHGVLLINELSSGSLFAHLTFGLLEGWWLHSDTELRVEGSPAIAPSNWEALLRDEGFESITFPATAAHRLGQQVIVATSNGVVRTSVSEANDGSEGDGEKLRRDGAEGAVTVPANLPPSSQNASELAASYLTTLVSQILRIPPSTLNPTDPWVAFGIDSILGLRVTDVLSRKFSSINSTTLFEYPNLRALATHLVETQAARVAELAGPERGPDTGASGEVDVPLRGKTEGRRRLPSPTSKPKDLGGTQIAVIGMSGRYPQASNIDAYWENLAAGMNCITEIPNARWDWQAYYDPEKSRCAPGKMYSKWGGFIEDIDAFDPLFFGISPREAERMSPQERLFLQEAYACISDAGYTPESICDSRRVGVFVGVMNSNYGTAPSYWSVANRVSYVFGFGGPSIAIDTACSSSLTAIHMALDSLYSGASDCALVGGVNLIIEPDQYINLSELSMLSSGNECRAFGANADGFVDAEAVGAVLLKPLASAIEAGDQIYGVILGSAINHGGRTNGYTVPNPGAQRELISQALRRSGVHARTISYVEAHGTGTSLGDPIEVAGLSRAFSEHTEDKRYCALGSVKSNIGHTESAAGVAGLTKVLLQMKHGKLVRSLNSASPNPNIDFHETPFLVQQETAIWERPVVSIDGATKQYPRIAGISSFGAGGANAHVIVKEHVDNSARGRIPNDANCPVVILLSGKNDERLTAQAKQLLQFTKSNANLSLVNMAYTLQVGREAMDARIAFTAASVGDLLDKLEQFLSGQKVIAQCFRGNVKRTREPKSALPGDGQESAIEAWLTGRELSKLAEAWVRGLVIDWSRLYGKVKPRRVSLPTYPFLKERYWLEAGKRSVEPSFGGAKSKHVEESAMFDRLLKQLEDGDITVETAVRETKLGAGLERGRATEQLSHASGFRRPLRG
ncbi:SDR family NAD(P)-dependent oxidoreductase [Bradyrhizobium nitroreducens]|uniref:SDR family NAD(P)-dependent oxidoreductase n=1 Tax=Bradyrhizobium nitroreducens TaxID=709803 RepID=UPI001374AB13|nr:SDR family NAD(P)-dependent oxidoreductase [Bradyrhizobium nitroreducens]